MSYNNDCIYIKCLSADTIEANNIIGPVLAVIGNPSPDPPRDWNLNYPPIVDGDISALDTPANALWKTSKLVSLLLPAGPPDLSTITIILAGTYSAVQAVAPYATLGGITNNALPQTNTTTPFGNASSGTLSAFVDGLNAGTTVLTAADNSGTYGALVIVSDTAFNAFYNALTAYVRTTVALAPNNTTPHTYQLVHSLSGTSNLLAFYQDNAIAPGVVGNSISYTTDSYSSGVPYVSGTVDINFTVSNAVRKFYNSTWVGRGSSAGFLTTVQALPSGADRNEGSSPIFALNLPVLAAVYTEDVQVSASGQNSVSVITTIIMSNNIRIDTKSSNESLIRVQSGQGIYPVGYGGVFNSATSLVAVGNEELQYMNGLFQFPPAIDYSGSIPVGPNYTTVGAVSPRYATFETAIVNKGNVIITFTDPQNINLIIEPTMTVQIKAEGITGWLSVNTAYGGVGTPIADGDAALFVGLSSPGVLYATFGPTTYTATIYVRVGLTSASTIKFSNLTYQFI